ncbi:MAG: rod shape-determining protein MreC [Oscillospiraceae bacterium]|nr:rod shape-determining protein MreC [Oscillospiraceae bacterium]
MSPRAKLLLVLAVFVAALLAISSALFGSTFLHKGVQAILTPIRGGVNAMTRQVERYYNYVFNYESLEAENAYLQSKISQMEEEMRSADALERENKRLKELLNLQEEHIDYKMDGAYIVSWDSSGWKSTFSINKGSKAGLAEGMIAVTELGQVVGIITDIGANWATVTTLLDTSIGISASIASSGYTGVVQGSLNPSEKGSLRMSYLPSNAILRNNDQVVTTGSTVYPKDLILGYIVNAGYDETGVSKFASLAPAANFESLEQVFIITQFQSE